MNFKEIKVKDFRGNENTIRCAPSKEDKRIIIQFKNHENKVSPCFIIDINTGNGLPKKYQLKYFKDITDINMKLYFSCFQLTYLASAL